MKNKAFLALTFGIAVTTSPILIKALQAAPPAKATGKSEKMIPMAATAKVAEDWKTQLQGDKRIAHVLNRMGFGARPGDIERVRQLGLDKWIANQLNPQSIDDSKVESEIAKLPLLNANADLLRLAYEGDSGVLRRIFEDRAKAAREQKQQERAAGANGVVPFGGATLATANPAVGEVLTDRQQELLAEFEASGLQRESSFQALGELTSAKLARAINSNRQLQEALADFWSNHFNVDVRKGPVRTMKVLDEREVIRPHLFTSFREMLGASAKSPAMLWYLDNHRSTVEIPAPRAGGKARGGLNENYARELMELHTLGVDGGYTQQDVTEVARCFTGWSVGNGASRPILNRVVNRRNRLAGQANEPNAPNHLLTFRFNAGGHDKGVKKVLGNTISAGDQNDGETVLDLLAAHPSTAKFIAHKLCVRFIADHPPTSAVDRVAKAFTDSKGDLKSVYRVLFTSPEFTSVAAYRAKIKSPFEFAVSAVRALDGNFALADADAPRQRQWLVALGKVSANENNNNRTDRLPRRPIGSEIANMGQPLWACQPPTGWNENSQSWVSSSALVARLNFALSLTSGRIGDVELNSDILRAEPVNDLARDLLSGDIDNTTRAVIEREARTAPNDGAKMRALILGSPEFQRR
jgi:uncharacterized protein (DUF1800 family)